MAKVTITESHNFDKKDVFNIIGAVTMDKVKGTRIEAIGAALGTDISHETGEVVPTGYIKATDGKIYSTISPTAHQSIEALIDLLADEGGKPIAINVETRRSNSGRDFIILTLE